MRATVAIVVLMLGQAAAAVSGAGACGAGSGDPVFIATGPDSGLDGYLDVSPDVFGSYARFGGQGDHYNPLGAHTLQEAAFVSLLLLFVGDTEREVLSVTQFPDDRSLDRFITAPNVATDTNGDGVDDTLTSAFMVFSASRGTTDLSFNVTQHVERVIPLGGNPVAILTQQYEITNNSDSPIDFELVSVFDGDLTWVGDFEDDSVGTGTNGSPQLDRFVFEQEAGDPTTAITISSTGGDAYVGSKLGITPDPNDPKCPAYGFGTDGIVIVWNEFGIPDCWRNHIASVGYEADGESAATPPGCGVPCDALVILEIPVSLAAGDSTTVIVIHTYGANTPGGAPGLPTCPWDLNGDLGVDIFDLLALLAVWGTNPGGAPDFDGDGTVGILDLVTLLANWGPCR